MPNIVSHWPRAVSYTHLKEEYLERDTNAIAAYGLNEGYIDIQVGAPQVDYKDDGIYVTFVVNEGPRYTVRNVVFAGDVIDSEDNMLEVVQMDDWKKSNDYFSLTVMQEDSKRLTDHYADYGYAFAEVDTKPVSYTHLDVYKRQGRGGRRH